VAPRRRRAALVPVDHPDRGAGVVQSIVFDATEDVERDQELAFEQRRYQTLVEQMPMVTLRADGNGVVEYVSPQVEERSGRRGGVHRAVNSENWLERSTRPTAGGGGLRRPRP
jgi:PAS domain-containing protein